MGPAESIVYLIAGLAMAVLVWNARKPPGRWPWQSAVRMAVPVAMVWLILGTAACDGRGTRLQASLGQFQINGAALPISDEPVEVFRVGDSSDHSDLLVRPYSEDRLNQASRLDEPRQYVTLYASRDPAKPQFLKVKYRIRNYPAVAAEDVPGMFVTWGKSPEHGRMADGLFWLSPGQKLTASIWRSKPAEDTDLRNPSVERRAFTLINQPGDAVSGPRLAVKLQTPMLAAAGDCRVPRTNLIATVSEDARDLGFLDPRNLEFRDLGAGGYANAVLSADSTGSVFGGEPPCSAAQMDVSWPAEGPRAGLLQLHFSRLAIPWFLPVLFTCAALLTWFLARSDLVEDPSLRVVLPVLFYLLGLRMLVAIGAAVADPGSAAGPFHQDALTAIVGLPPIAIALLRRSSRTQAIDWLMLAAGLVVFWVAVELWGGIGRESFFRILLCLLALGLIVLRLALPDLRPLKQRMSALGQRVIAWTANISPHLRRQNSARTSTRDLRQRLAGFRDWLLAPLEKNGMLRVGMLIMLLAMVSRLALRVFGIREAIERPFRISLSLPYLALLLLGLGCIVAALVRRAEARGAGVVLAMFSLLTIPLAMIAVNDKGFLFVHLLPLCIVIAALCNFSWHESKARAAAYWFLLVAPSLLLLGGVAGYSLYVSTKVADPDAPVMERIESALDLSEDFGNDIRLIQIFSPAKVEAIGTIAAYEQLEQTSLLHSMTDTVMGEGYLRPVRLRSMRKEQTWDYVAAVHVMRPFGRAGAVALLAVFLAFAAAVTSICLRQQEESGSGVGADLRRNASLLAVWTMLGAGLYMVLANLLMVPFTGRNVYFLGVVSNSEMLEAMLLLIVSGLALNRDPQA